MKKLIITFIAIVATSTAIYAQIDRWPTLGLRGGVYHAYMRFEDNLQFDRVFNPGFYAALEIDIPVGVFLSLQPEIGFIQKGSKIRAADSTRRLLFNTMEFSALTKFYAIDNPLFSMIVMVGPSVGVNLSADEIVDKLNGFPSSRPISIGEGQEFKRLEASLVGSLAFHFPGNVIADLRFQLGISNVNNARVPDNFHRGTSLSIGYLFAR